MTIYVNDNQLEFSLENEKTLGDILNSLEREFEKNNGTMFNITVDGENVPADKIDIISKKNIEDVQKLEITAVFGEDVVAAFKTLSDNIEEINKDFENLPVYLQGSDNKKISETLTNFADIFDNLCHLISLTALFPETFSDKKVDNMTLADFIKDFEPLLTDFEKAISENDTVLIGDISEYEIKPRFENLLSAIRDF